MNRATAPAVMVAVIYALTIAVILLGAGIVAWFFLPMLPSSFWLAVACAVFLVCAFRRLGKDTNR